MVYGTRPEWIKLEPLYKELVKNHYEVKVIQVQQHTDLIKDAYADVRIPYVHSVYGSGNRLDGVVTTVFQNAGAILDGAELVIVQGDTTTAFAGALAAFHRKVPIAPSDRDWETVVTTPSSLLPEP